MSHPGVNRRSEAEVITVGLGEQKVLPEMRIKAGTRCEILVQVSGGVGKPAPSIELAFAYPDYPHIWISPGEESSAEGKATVFAVFPGTVFVKAVKPNEDGSTLESDIAEVNSCPAEPVLLKLNHRVTDLQEPQGK